jgi:hypothetical protein
VAVTGALMIGGYSIQLPAGTGFRHDAGVLATVLGVQPILTLLWMERRVSVARLAGLTLALAGLVTIVADSLMAARFSMAGWGRPGRARCMTVGAIGQKGVRQAPVEILPLQYTVALAMCLLCVPFQPFRFEHVPGFFFPLLWMGIVISVVATLLFYRLIQAGNLVNVTSLFYLVPPATVLLDFVAEQPARAACAGRHDCHSGGAGAGVSRGTLAQVDLHADAVRRHGDGARLDVLAVEAQFFGFERVQRIVLQQLLATTAPMALSCCDTGSCPAPARPARSGCPAARRGAWRRSFTPLFSDIVPLTGGDGITVLDSAASTRVVTRLPASSSTRRGFESCTLTSSP